MRGPRRKKNVGDRRAASFQSFLDTLFLKIRFLIRPVKMQRQKIIFINGDKAEIREFDGDSLGLETLQNLVGGYIQIVPLSKDFSVVVNEEGLLLDLSKTVFIESVFSGPVVVVKTSGECGTRHSSFKLKRPFCNVK